MEKWLRGSLKFDRKPVRKNQISVNSMIRINEFCLYCIIATFSYNYVELPEARFNC